VIHDVGSGALIDLAPYGVQGEPSPSESVRLGADVVLSSGDKLLGGPQCGIVLGKREVVKRLSAHPLARALRVDKLTLAALAATLRLYRDPNVARLRVPFLALLTTPIENLRQRAKRLAPQIAAMAAGVTAEVIEEQAEVGGGSGPGQAIATICLAVTAAATSAERLAWRLRTGKRPVVARIKQERVLLDLRTVFARQDLELIEAVAAALGAAPAEMDPHGEATGDEAAG
jgi:L-seryl-tRNA(Ser) seleniumtransferase